MKTNSKNIYFGNINRTLFDMVPQNVKVLEIGCNSGFFGERLISEKKCIVHGLDYDSAAIKQAESKLHSAKVFDLEAGNYDEIASDYDVVVIGDVLEHLRSPELSLLKLVNKIKKGGLIIVSLPNVANIHVRLSLLLGNWDYKESGILDNTHLRFYTHKTSLVLLKLSGLKVIKEGYTPGVTKYLGKFENTLVSMFPRLFAMQFVYKCTYEGNN